MEWALTFAAFVIGSVFGYVGHTVLTIKNKDKSQNKQLEQTQLELYQYKQEVSDHFDGHYKQLSELTHLVNKVNQQWNTSASLLTSPTTDKHLADLAPVDNRSVATDSTYTEKTASL
ncbi:DUF1043 domain-containing protein [Shewanella sp. Choline-02u-19]|jgi:uncharacterized membrane-anchored protein YhcB (DUF1043 family)|uniref:ZapG family protein n=1 Tax=unclassified Shewanella TaxID=196818 RepID=UPI000C332CC1|nr:MULTISPECIES: DUF1043 family protein [unclassified Shewanella]PKG57880.1 DUF1043 domain-containing protein [Shewanella sp. GutDb-MelDb]PKG74512.1 DUF1043 domain-containing protein [Shewanella sp. GutCb]PKH55505.1 DUF1043 domain-containing protein [Shewanella sp. Bg11-22]PKI28851.1 DUF1043 domain-containing protein [Shewanella sp. Choline-02u-19]